MILNGHLMILAAIDWEPETLETVLAGRLASRPRFLVGVVSSLLFADSSRTVGTDFRIRDFDWSFFDSAITSN